MKFCFQVYEEISETVNIEGTGCPGMDRDKETITEMSVGMQ